MSRERVGDSNKQTSVSRREFLKLVATTWGACLLTACGKGSEVGGEGETSFSTLRGPQVKVVTNEPTGEVTPVTETPTPTPTPTEAPPLTYEEMVKELFANGVKPEYLAAPLVTREKSVVFLGNEGTLEEVNSSVFAMAERLIKERKNYLTLPQFSVGSPRFLTLFAAHPEVSFFTRGADANGEIYYIDQDGNRLDKVDGVQIKAWGFQKGGWLVTVEENGLLKIILPNKESLVAPENWVLFPCSDGFEYIATLPAQAVLGTLTLVKVDPRGSWALAQVSPEGQVLAVLNPAATLRNPFNSENPLWLTNPNLVAFREDESLDFLAKKQIAEKLFGPLRGPEVSSGGRKVYLTQDGKEAMGLFEGEWWINLGLVGPGIEVELSEYPTKMTVDEAKKLLSDPKFRQADMPEEFIQNPYVREISAKADEYKGKINSSNDRYRYVGKDYGPYSVERAQPIFFGSLEDGTFWWTFMPRNYRKQIGWVSRVVRERDPEKPSKYMDDLEFSKSPLMGEPEFFVDQDKKVRYWEVQEITVGLRVNKLTLVSPQKGMIVGIETDIDGDPVRFFSPALRGSLVLEGYKKVSVVERALEKPLLNEEVLEYLKENGNREINKLFMFEVDGNYFQVVSDDTYYNRKESYLLSFLGYPVSGPPSFVIGNLPRGENIAMFSRQIPGDYLSPVIFLVLEIIDDEVRVGKGYFINKQGNIEVVPVKLIKHR